MNMNSRWKFEIKDINSNPTTLYAEPRAEIMTEFVKTATDELARRCAIAEEQFIFESCPDATLKRIIKCCNEILDSRQEGEK